MKKILIVLTGGTIGSRVEEKKIDVADESPLLVLERYREVYGEEEEFEVLRPFTILSENMRRQEWTILARQLWSLRYEDYRGIIVTHGSDTLSYTSALMGMIFAHVPVPMVFTAGSHPLDDRRSNGLANFRGAVELIRTPSLRGVFTVYRDDRGKMQVYLATRITEADPYLDQFGSFGGSPLGEIREGKISIYEERINPTLEELKKKRRPALESCPAFTNSVLLIRPYPGLSYEAFDLTARPAAVLHYLYHSATACMAGETDSFQMFQERCRRAGIPVYAASYKALEGRAYVTSMELLRQGAIPLVNISAEAAYAKILLLHNQGLNGIKTPAEQNIYYEHIPSFALKTEGCC